MITIEELAKQAESLPAEQPVKQEEHVVLLSFFAQQCGLTADKLAAVYNVSPSAVNLETEEEQNVRIAKRNTYPDLTRHLFPPLFRQDGNAFFVKTEGEHNWMGHTDPNGDTHKMRISPELAKALRQEAKQNHQKYHRVSDDRKRTGQNLG